MESLKLLIITGIPIKLRKTKLWKLILLDACTQTWLTLNKVHFLIEYERIIIPLLLYDIIPFIHRWRHVEIHRTNGTFRTEIGAFLWQRSTIVASAADWASFRVERNQGLWPWRGHLQGALRGQMSDRFRGPRSKWSQISGLCSFCNGWAHLALWWVVVISSRMYYVFVDRGTDVVL